jgi:hypothetical protein
MLLREAHGTIESADHACDVFGPFADHDLVEREHVDDLPGNPAAGEDRARDAGALDLGAVRRIRGDGVDFALAQRLGHVGRADVNEGDVLQRHAVQVERPREEEDVERRERHADAASAQSAHVHDLRLRHQQVGAVREVDHQRHLHLALELVAVLQDLEQRERPAVDLVVLEGALRVVHRDEFDQPHFHAFVGEIALLLREVQELERRPADQGDPQLR